MKRRYFWDFFGPAAERTAEHFREHLEQFLVQNALSGCEVGLASAGAGHHAAFCVAPSEVQSAIERALRPRRSEAEMPPG
jgi:hypothetical protein